MFFLSTVLKDTDRTEVRIFTKDKGVVSGVFGTKKLDKLVQAVEIYNEQCNAYYTINGTNKPITNNLNTFASNLTKDSDVNERLNMVIDIDPTGDRKSGEASTDEELGRAIKVSKGIAKELKEVRGFKAPITVMSGNGVNLYFKIRMDNDEESKNRVKNFIKVLRLKYNSDLVDIDGVVFNASRIFKIPGTLSNKGADTDERPHRLSTVLNTPEEYFVTGNAAIDEYIEANTAKDQNVTTNRFIPKTQNDMDSSSNDIGEKLRGRFRNCSFLVDMHSNPRDQNYRLWYSLALAIGAVEVKYNQEYFDVFKKISKGYATYDYDETIKKYEQAVEDLKEEHTWVTKCETLVDEGYTCPRLGECPYETPANLLLNIKKGGNGGTGGTLGSKKSKEKKSSNDLITLIEKKIKIFKTSNEYFVEFEDEGINIESFNSAKFQNFLKREYYEMFDKFPTENSISKVFGYFDIYKEKLSKLRKLFKRVAKVKDTLYYSLNNDKSEKVKITDSSVEIISVVKEVIFNDSKNMAKQARPNLEDPDISLIRKYTQFQDEGEYFLYLIVLISSFMPEIAHPIISVNGEKGAGKSTFSKLTKELIDPSNSNLTRFPKSEKDIVLNLSNNWCIAYDNMSYLTGDKSDLLCMASTGGVFSSRKLYTDNQEVQLQFKRVLILNGIHTLAKNTDLIDRLIHFNLKRISAEKRMTEEEFWHSFENDKPSILGGIFHILAKMLKIYPTVALKKLPRMADFAKYGFAIGEALEKGGGNRFLEAYSGYREGINEKMILENPLALAIKLYMRDKSIYEGFFEEFYNELNNFSKNHNSIDTRCDTWPGSSSILSRRMNELNSNLDEIGITFKRIKTAEGTKIHLTNSNFTQMKRIK